MDCRTVNSSYASLVRPPELILEERVEDCVDERSCERLRSFRVAGIESIARGYRERDVRSDSRGHAGRDHLAAVH